MGDFSSTYQESRERFLALVNEFEGQLESHQHPSLKGAQGEDLFVDVAVFGDPKASAKLFFVAGVHGLEGLVSSAVFHRWLKGGWLAKLPKDMSMVMVHGVNPWGISHFRRTNENNVDLNRSFIEFPVPEPNELYGELHSLVCLPQWSEESVAKAVQGATEFSKIHGETGLVNTVMQGQYEYPDGLAFGGQERQWSTKVLMETVKAHLLSAEKVFYFDWHTGLGEYGETFFVHNYGPESSQLNRLHTVFGEKVHQQNAGFLGGRRPDYRGVLIAWLEETLVNAKISCLGAVIEFGTRKNKDLKKTLLIDRWLSVAPESFSPEERAMAIEALKEDFNPSDPGWRKSVVEESEKLFDQIITAL